MHDTNVIGEKVYQVRKLELNKTQEEFAEMLDISKDTVSNIERGEVIPNTLTLIKLSEVTGKPIEFFLSRKDDADEL